MIIRRFVIISFVLLLSEVTLCQNLYISNYTEKEYRSSKFTTSPQNWDIEQDSLGRMYIANSSGALLFDGLTWRVIPGSENKNLYSLAKSEDEIIFAGGRDELGYFRADSLGKVIFQSLRSLLPDLQRSPGQIENMRVNGNVVYFRTKEGLYVYKENELIFYQLKSDFHGIEFVDNEAVIQDNYGNLLVLHEEKLDTLFSFGSTLNSSIICLSGMANSDQLLFTSESGIFKLLDGEITKWPTELDGLISTASIKKVIEYPDLNLFGIATKGAGILFLGYDGKIKKRIGVQQGLTSNTCYNLFQDKNNELWACLDIGLARIEYPSALSYFDYTNGLNGVVNTMIDVKSTVYAGTTNGLYVLNNNNQFHKTDITDEVWDIKLIEGIIWLAASSGIYQISEGKSRQIIDLSARTIESSKNNNVLWIGLSDGLGMLLKRNGTWVFDKKFEKVNHEVRTIVIESDSIIWCSYEKISRVVYNNESSNAIDAKTLEEDNGYSEDFFVVESYHLRDRIYFGTGMGLFTYDADEKRLVQDSSFGPRFSDSQHEAWAIAEDSDRNIWLTSNRVIGKLEFENNKVISWDTLAFARLKSTDVWRIVPIRENRLIYFCTTEGLFKYDQNVKKIYSTPYATIINKVEIDRDSIVSYLAVDSPQITSSSAFSYDYNDVRFSYSATSYNYDEKIQFSFLLEGYDKEWSDWETESFKEYTNLPFGTYVFKVKGKNLYDVEAKTAQYAFSILRPWYRTYWAYGIASFLFLCVVVVIDQIQRKRLFKKQQARIRVQQMKLERERQISSKLRQVDRLKDEFLANTSHELRTPLNGIIGIAESLYEESQNIDEEEMKQNLSMVIASGKRLASMVDSILDYSKLKTQNLEIRKKPVDLKSIVSVVLTMSRPLISKNELFLINDVPESLPLLEADENRLQQILYNLVGNAIKFTNKGNITVSAREKGTHMEVEVRDEGAGIPEDRLDKIFESYEQVNTKMDRDYIGTGLGLTITKKLVELHHGTVQVHSTLGVGSSFIFTIPISMQESDSWVKTPIVEMEESVSTQPIQSQSVVDAQFQLLIVDDEPINRQVLANQLKHEPFNLDMAISGEEALQKVDIKKYDLILLDIMMPRMSGFEVCLKIREKYLLSELPVIFITAKDQVIDLVEGLTYGGNDYITKPFSKQELMARIKTHLNLLKINESYSRFIPIEFLKSLGRESIMDVHLGDQIEKDVTILFSDIRDYTTLSEGMLPKENFEFLNSFLGKMGPVVRENNGFIMQYLGDGLMSVFLHNPMDAIKASITMLAQIEAYNVSRENKDRIPIRVGIGLHSGKLVLGVLGDEKRMDANVVADSVNTASRMEGLTKYYGASVIMSENTLEGIKEETNIHYRFLGLVTVKGKIKPLKIYEILDGIDNKLNKIKIETTEVFEAGLAFYFDKDFINAATSFKKVTTLNPQDVSAQMYLKLSAKYMVEVVPDDWTGVEHMMLK